jgi:hypothetical protein
MKQTHKIAYDYCMALIHQRAGEELVSKAFGSLGSDNSIFGLAEPIEGAYTELVHELLGEDLFDWLMWWMYETSNGTHPMLFEIDGVSYDPTFITLYRFLEIVDPPVEMMGS